MYYKNFFSRLLSTLLFVVLLFNTSAILAQDFITEWEFPNGTSQVIFNAQTNGEVHYSWSTASTSGQGHFTMGTAGQVTITVPAMGPNQRVRLSMEPANLRRFFIDDGLHKLNLKAVSQWGAVPWSSMNSAFEGCEDLVIPTTAGLPDLKNVTDMSLMFNNATNFNSNIGDWNTENVWNMSGMFRATRFNQPIANWNTSKVYWMSLMFSGATSFNQPIGNWNTANVTTMQAMFAGAENFNQPIGSWNTSNVTDMQGMFRNARKFNQPIGNWNVHNVIYMNNMFSEAISFNQPIGNWNTNSVELMNSMFEGALSFNQPIGNWNTGNVISMCKMFDVAKNFNQPIGNWNTQNVENMSSMFNFANSFNQPINNWNTAKVKDMSWMFAYTIFNQPIGDWNTEKVTNLKGMFAAATNFNQPIGNWNTESVDNMSIMFTAASSFNQPIGNWNTAKVKDMKRMFENATSFNQSLSTWNTEKVTDMNNMFLNATSFNQNIGNWKLDAIIAPGLEGMLSNSGLDCGNYSETLIGWRLNNPSVMGLTLGAAGRRYGTNAVNARAALTSITGQDWTIHGDSPSGTLCLATEDPNTCCNSERAISMREASALGKVESSTDETSPTTQSLEDQASSQPALKVYPNPLSSLNTLHVSVSGVALSPEATLRIRDMQGRIVHQQTLSNQTDLQLSSLSAGVYLLEATDGKAVWREKVVLTQ